MMSSRDQKQVEVKIAEMVRRIVDGFGPERIILFGSFAKGRFCMNVRPETIHLTRQWVEIAEEDLKNAEHTRRVSSNREML